MTDRILILFQRQRIRKTTCEYRCSKLDKEDDADMIRYSIKKKTKEYVRTLPI